MTREEEIKMVSEAKDQAEKLCYVIEALPASIAQTDLSVQASILLRNVREFTLPEPERWWYCNYLNSLYENKHNQTDNPGNGCCVEVPPSDLPYVRECMKREDIAEFEYRTHVKENEDYIVKEQDGTPSIIARFHAGLGIALPENHFVRKAKPAEKVQKEFEVYANGEKLYVKDFIGGSVLALSDAWLYAIDRGMWPQFWFEDANNWFEYPSLMHNGQPATCVKMRVFVKEDRK